MKPHQPLLAMFRFSSCSRDHDWYFTDQHCQLIHDNPGGGGALNFFSGRGVRPGFPKCGACELTFASEKGGLWAENFQIWGLVSWKFQNLGACELKISKFGGLWAKIWVKIEAVEAKISKFSQKGVLWTDLFCLKWDPCERQERREKGVFRAAHPHTPFLGQCPPRTTTSSKSTTDLTSFESSSTSDETTPESTTSDLTTDHGTTNCGIQLLRVQLY